MLKTKFGVWGRFSTARFWGDFILVISRLFTVLGFYFAGFLNVSTAGQKSGVIDRVKYQYYHDLQPFRIKILLGTTISSRLSGRLSR